MPFAFSLRLSWLLERRDLLDPPIGVSILAGKLKVLVWNQALKASSDLELSGL